MLCSVCSLCWPTTLNGFIFQFPQSPRVKSGQTSEKLRQKTALLCLIVIAIGIASEAKLRPNKPKIEGSIDELFTTQSN
ncbi:uncharacterized protein BDW70DRAFT_127646 [Aspergillus foveolatus]|uniref:uncharacterized protein n=1 Tax=Aspergillus foveolatus TaxID=210207 RepID=UPI003CCDC6D0